MARRRRANLARQSTRPIRRRRTRRRRRNNGRSNLSRTLGALVATGAKTLLSCLPTVGPAFAKASDFLFKSIGISENEIKANQDTVVYVYGLAARFAVRPAAILIGTHAAIQIGQNDLAGQHQFMTQYRDARVISFTVQIEPVNEMSHRQGTWTLALQPCFSMEDRNAETFTSNIYPTQAGMAKQYLHTIGSTSKPLSLTFRPQASDGIAYQYMPIDSPFCEVSILFTNMSRADSGNFDAEDFACQVRISGTLQLRTTAASMPADGDNAHNYGGYVYTTLVDDRLAKSSMVVDYGQSRTIFSTDVKFKDRGNQGGVTVNGSIISVTSSRGFEYVDKMDC